MTSNFSRGTGEAAACQTTSGGGARFKKPSGISARRLALCCNGTRSVIPVASFGHRESNRRIVFKLSAEAIRAALGALAVPIDQDRLIVYAQVVKTWRNNSVTRVNRRAVIGTTPRLEKALEASEDSTRANPAYIERLQLTIRQSVVASADAARLMCVLRGICIGNSSSPVAITSSSAFMRVCG